MSEQKVFANRKPVKKAPFVRSVKPKTLVLRTAGTNCDKETCYAFELAGARCDLIHVKRLTEGKCLLSDYDILVIPGGFSYGDDIAAGRVLANEIKHSVYDQLRRFTERGGLVLGICNGFQVLVKLGLLPNIDSSYRQQVSLAWNSSNRFEDRWVYLKATSSKSVFVEKGQMLYLPIAHAEGKIVLENEETKEKLVTNDQIVFKYVDKNGNAGKYPVNPNGSILDIAGICDPIGRVLGVMPHPERHIFGYQHPKWTRNGLKEEGDGFSIFRNAVNYAKQYGG
ncbi:MAG: phosphoribosylformylglycinamidine synthase I [Planctomycetota bacterium]